MNILEMRALRGPNVFSRFQVIYMRLDIGSLEKKPSDEVPGFKDRLLELIPTLREHSCSPGYPGGFVERLERGTWAGHIVEHVAIELQCLAGIEVGFGKTLDTEEEGIYELVFRYKVEAVGLRAGEDAVRIVDSLVKKGRPRIGMMIEELKELREETRLGPSTQSIVDEATRRGIPYIRLNDDSYVQLGLGLHLRRIQASMTDDTSAVGVEIADDKDRTKRILDNFGIPVPRGDSTSRIERALEIADEIGYPVVVKPLICNHGKGITTNVKDRKELKVALKAAKKFHDTVLVERYLTGSDFRILVIDGKVVAAARREPAHVVGDGKSTIRQLVDGLNTDPERGIGHERLLTRVKVDFMTRRLLKQSGLTMDDVLPAGRRLFLKSTANMSTGGTATDVTDEVHASVRFLAENIARIVGLNVMGIDVIAPDLARPLSESGGAVIELNAAPGFRMHIQPSTGKPRDVAGPMVDMLFPPGIPSRIPIIAVTGTNGKTTTVRLIAHMLKYTGKRVGMCCTDGVVIENTYVLEGDYSGPEGARHVLRNPLVDHAVLEVARGGIIRRGMGIEDSDVGVILNISEDHLGQQGVSTVDDLARVKAVVAESVRETGRAVLNADDPRTLAIKEIIRAPSILFSTDPESQVLKEHVAAGGTAVTVEDSSIVVRDPSLASTIVQLIDVPFTLEGRATFNVQNCLAAVAACHSQGMKVEDMKAGLMTFDSSVGQNPGRMNRLFVSGFKVIIDYAHNVAAVRALGETLPYITKGRKIGMVSGTGSRMDEDILEFGRAVAAVYDRIVITDTDPVDREPGETAGLVLEGILSAGFPKEKVDVVLDGRGAARMALEAAGSGDLVVIQADEFQQILDLVIEFRDELIPPGNE